MRGCISKGHRPVQRIIELEPNHLDRAIGIRWCIEQSGDTKSAVAHYRSLIELAWASEKGMTSAGLGWYSITIGDGAVPDSVARSGRRTATKLRRSGRASGRCSTSSVRSRRLSCPCGMDSMSPTLWTSKPACRSTRTAADSRNRWSWITRDAGWLVFDQRDTRKVTSALQLFGSVTFWLFWDTGYDALRALDDNADGTIDGAELNGLAIWQDANTNGISEAGEVKPLGDWGIVSLSCRFRRDERHPDEIAFSPAGVTFRNGVVRTDVRRRAASAEVAGCPTSSPGGTSTARCWRGRCCSRARRRPRSTPSSGSSDCRRKWRSRRSSDSGRACTASRATTC